MRKQLQSSYLVSFGASVALAYFLLLVPHFASAADLNFDSATTLNLSGVGFTTVTVAAGSGATTLAVGTTTFTVTVPSGSTFTVNASSDITFTNDGSVATTCGATSSLILTGPKTNVLVTPTNIACPRVSSSRSDTTAPAMPSNIATASSNSSSITIIWTDPTDSDLATIAIYRNNGGTTPVDGGAARATIAKGVKTFTDTNLTAGETYAYQLKAQDTTGNVSDPTAKVSQTVAALVPTTGGGGGMPVSPPVVPKIPVEILIPTTPPMETVEEKIVARAQQLDTIRSEAMQVFSVTITELAQTRGQARSAVVEEKFNATVEKVVSATVTAVVREKILGFVTYGTVTTTRLGGGERAGVVNSFRDSLGHDPESAADWEDVVKIANGRFPSQTNVARETEMEATFQKIYKRAPNRVNAKDNAALVVMTYGLRSASRNLNSEKVAIAHFNRIFGHAPVSASDWDTTRAIAYSGATR